jgi:endonuclease YncB( thermonuclease family)
MFNIFTCFKASCNTDIENETHNVKYSDTIKFIPPISGGSVIKVYDGDTITIASRLPYDASPLYRFSVRLRGIDCPEMRTSNENEKKCAEIAKNLVYHMVMGKNVILLNVDNDKYGRLLADVIVDGTNISDLLLEKRLAVKYDGGTKHVPNDWLKLYKNNE